jgi:thioredoxin
MPVLAVTDATFEQEVLASELPVLVDLHADWCQPCKQLAPIVESVATELEGRLKVVKIDVDRNPMVARSFRVQSIPMLVVIHQGKVVQHHMGLLDKAGLLRLIEAVLPRPANEVKPKELLQLLMAKRAIAVDVRDGAAFGRYRIPGAIHIPRDELERRARELHPIDGRVRVLYSRSSDDAKDLAEKLAGQGIQVGYLSGGFLHWEADGLDVERGG